MAVLFAERTATVPALPYGLLASVFCTFLAVAVAAPIGTARQQVSHTEAGPYVNAAGSQPLGQLLVEPPQGQRACAGDGLTPAAQGLALSSPPRARCSRSAANRNAALCDYRIVPQLHRFSSDIIVNSVVRCEDAVSTAPDLF